MWRECWPRPEPWIPLDSSPSVMRAALLLIRTYRLLLSSFTRGACRYTPSCSDYAHQAIERHGIARGGYLAVRRLLRCHPLGSSGYDPVP